MKKHEMNVMNDMNEMKSNDMNKNILCTLLSPLEYTQTTADLFPLSSSPPKKTLPGILGVFFHAPTSTELGDLNLDDVRLKGKGKPENPTSRTVLDSQN